MTGPTDEAKPDKKMLGLLDCQSIPPSRYLSDPSAK